MPTIPNVELLIMNILLLTVLFFFNIRHWKPKIINPLSTIYLLAMGGSALEIAAFIVDGNPSLIWLNYLSNMLYLGSIGMIGWCMLVHCNGQFPQPLWKNRRQHMLWMIPVLLELVLLFSAPLSGLIFAVSPEGFYYRADTFFLQLIPYGYLLVTTGFGIYWFFRTQTTKERNNYLAIAMFAIPPVFLGGIQLLVKANSLDILEFSMSVSLLANYAVSQDNRITRDTLTRLPNREVLDVVLAEKMNNERRGEKEKLFVMMGDLDGFKSINDTYGHLEGDRALIMVADALYLIGRNHKGMAARFGGDEFVIVVEGMDEETPRQMIAEIDAALQEMSEHEPFRLQMSVGFATYRQSDTIHDILKAADRELYMVKREKQRTGVLPVSTR